MISMVFAVFDSAARVYSPPFLAARDEIAKRMFYEACSDRNSTIGSIPRSLRCTVWVRSTTRMGVSFVNGRGRSSLLLVVFARR